jgi:hypothetical protein
LNETVRIGLAMVLPPEHEGNTRVAHGQLSPPSDVVTTMNRSLTVASLRRDWQAGFAESFDRSINERVRRRVSG